MKQCLHLIAWAFVALVIVYAAVHPDHGVLYGNPLACLGVGLIGLGLFVQTRRSLVRQAR